MLIRVTVAGMVMSVNAGQPLMPNSFTAAGMTNRCRPVSLKAACSISATESGISISVSSLKRWKAHFPIFVTEAGISVFMHAAISSLVAVLTMALQPFRESYTGFSSDTTMLHSPEQPPKTPSPIRVTEAGI